MIKLFKNQIFPRFGVSRLINEAEDTISFPKSSRNYCLNMELDTE